MQKDKAAIVITALESGKSLRASSKEAGISHCRVLAWIEQDREFANQYARAREIGYKLLADEIIELSDNPVSGITSEGIAHARLQVDSRKWMLAKMLPKLYGEKVTHEVSGTVVHAHELSDDALAHIATGSGAGTAVAQESSAGPSAVH